MIRQPTYLTKPHYSTQHKHHELHRHVPLERHPKNIPHSNSEHVKGPAEAYSVLPEDGIGRAVEEYFSGRTKTSDLLKRNGNGLNPNEENLVGLVDSNDLVHTAQITNQPVQHGNRHFGYEVRRAVALLSALAYLTTGCAVKFKVSGYEPYTTQTQSQSISPDLDYGVPAPDPASVPIVYLLGRKPKQIGVLTVPYYVLRPTKLIFIDAHDFLDFVHQAHKVTCKDDGLVKALETARISQQSHVIAQGLYKAACVDYSEIGINKFLKQLNIEQRNLLASSLEGILADKIKNYNVKATIGIGIHPIAREAISFAADATIWYFIISAATETGPFAKSIKRRPIEQPAQQPPPPPVVPPPI